MLGCRREEKPLWKSCHWRKVQVKVKVKFTLEQATKAEGGLEV